MMMHYYDVEHEPARGEVAKQPEFNADGDPAFYAVCGANMNTAGDGPDKCPACATKVKALGLDDEVAGAFDPNLANEVRNHRNTNA
jgi:hypothetical protein